MSRSFVIDDGDGTITITPAALAQVVVAAAEQVEGARVRRQRRGLDVAVEDDRASVDVELALRYGLVVPEAAQEVQRRVAAAVGRFCALDVVTVDVSVEELDE